MAVDDGSNITQNTCCKVGKCVHLIPYCRDFGGEVIQK